MPRGQTVPITPEVLEWAVRTSGHSVQEIADRLGVSNDLVSEWVSGSKRPTLTPLRRLASFLRRPLAAFLLPAPPRVSTQQVEFRRPPDEHRRSLNPVEVQNLRQASRLQRGIAWILSELNEEPADLPTTTIRRDPESVAEELRRRLGVTVEQQLECSTDSKAMHLWRDHLQQSRVIVLLLPMGESSSRGFSLWDQQAPLIAVNTHWNNSARIFTMFHELAHLITRTNSVCSEHTHARLREGDDPVERWSERFAAAFLAPSSDLERVLVERFAWRRGQVIDDLRVARRLASTFHVSIRAMTLRLIDHRIAGWELYRQIPRLSDQ
ncbi:MAG: ImmA/IrrE family metallo-endopeptidase, partial [Nitrospirota bacterium]|nr:ImmA/IrrE family metallo-endopeptidase [Nitrospirota bacterium]